MKVADWIPFFLSWGAPFTAYAVVQIVAAVKLRGRSRLVSLIPVVPMMVVGWLTLSAFRQGSNLWPILLIFAGPVALLFVVIVWFSSSRAKPAPSK